MLKWLDIIKFANSGNPAPDRRVEKTPEEWKALLTPEQFNITRLKGTERAFSSELCSYFEPGRYACICCGTELFDAETKFESGTGWPSFTQPVKENAVAYHKDNSFVIRITHLVRSVLKRSVIPVTPIWGTFFRTVPGPADFVIV